MKCLVVADLHYALRQYDWLLATAPHFDLVVLAGDLLEISSPVERRAQVVVVRTYLEQLAQMARVIVCSGNHDLDRTDASGEMVAGWIGDLEEFGIAVDHASILMGDTLITVCPWWDGPTTRDGIATQLEAAARQPHARWIWVHHAPPSDSPTSWSGQRSYGDAELRRWIGQFQPDFVLSGHVHPAPFIPHGSWADQIGKTWVFNTGQQIGTMPAHIAFDFAAGRASWFSIYGDEALGLDRPLERPIPTLRERPEWLRDPESVPISE